MDLSFIEKVKTLLKLNFSSFLAIEEFIILLLVLIFLFYNERVQSKKVKIGISFLLLFLFSLFFFFYSGDICYILTEMGKMVLNAFYFPNLVFYVFTVFCSFLLLLRTIFQKKQPKWDKLISYFVLSLHMYLFIVFISYGLVNHLSFTTPAKIYKHDDLFVIVQASQVLFLLFLLYRGILYALRRKLKKKGESPEKGII